MNIFEISVKEKPDREKPVVLGRIVAVDAEEARGIANERFNLTGYRMLAIKFIEEEPK